RINGHIFRTRARHSLVKPPQGWRGHISKLHPPPRTGVSGYCYIGWNGEIRAKHAHLGFVECSAVVRRDISGRLGYAVLRLLVGIMAHKWLARVRVVAALLVFGHPSAPCNGWTDRAV